MKIGSLFSGYGGLDLAVRQVLGAETAWVSDIPQYDKKGVMVGNAPAILAHRFPGVPNLGDITRIDWADVEPVEVITGGFPCQDVSHAGKRAGLGEGTRTGLWAHMLAAIETIRPRLVVAENVRGLLSARADSDMEPCPWCLGDPTASPLRALGAVLGDLADIGMDARWYGLPISSVGGCHGRFRVFIAAYPAGDPWWLGDGDDSPAGVTASGLLLPTPGANLGYNGGPQHPDKRRDGGHTVSLEDAVHGLTLLPTPSASNPNDGEPVESWLARRERVKAAAQNGNGMGMPLPIAVQLLPTPMASDSKGMAAGDLRRNDPQLRALPMLLPTPRASDDTKGGPNQRGSSGDLMLPSAVHLLPTPTTDPTSGNGHARHLGGEVQLLPTPSVADAMGGHLSRSGDRSHELLLKGIATYDRFGEYAAAIASHEALTGRPAPAPTEIVAGDRKRARGTLGTLGRRRLSARFAEWMMTLPDGWVTDVPGLTRPQQLHAIGNGVAPLQAVAALRHLGNPNVWKDAA